MVYIFDSQQDECGHMSERLPFVAIDRTTQEYSTIVATVDTHTMGTSLWEYLRIKVHPDIASRSWSKITIRGRHSRSCPSRIMPIEKSDKPFNWQRPTTRINGDTIELQCFPGADYVHHYACIIVSYLALHGKAPEIVKYTLPTIEESISAVLNSNLKDIGAHEIAILGYVQGLQEFVSKDWQGSYDCENHIFGWQTRTLDNGCRIAFIGCRVSFWGDIAGNVVRCLQSLHGVKCVLYIGKLGSLHQNDIPNNFLATGNTSLVRDRIVSWDNVLQDALQRQGHHEHSRERGSVEIVRYGAHYTLSSVLEETKDWFEAQQARFDWVDPEIGHMAIASLEGHTKFGYLHIISDNLAKKFEYDLSNEREHEVLASRERVVKTIEGVLTEFFGQCGPDGP